MLLVHPSPGASPMRLLCLALLCPLLASAASCVEPTEVPVGGVYRVTLQAQGQEGGALFQLVGPGMQEIAAPGLVAAAHTSGDTMRVLILADPRSVASPAPISFQLTMAEGAGVPRASVLQVISATNRRRDFASAYTVTFAR